MIKQMQVEIKKALERLQFFAVGKVVAIDFDNYQVRAEILTSGMTTNWLRIGTEYSGNEFGEVKSPNIGDEILICFLDGNPRGQGVVLCRLFGKDLPPAISEDEIVKKHKSGTQVIIRKGGDYIIESNKVHILKENASDTCVTSQRLMQRLNNFIQIFNAHQHIGNLGAPTPPPMAPSAPVQKNEIEQPNVCLP